MGRNGETEKWRNGDGEKWENGEIENRNRKIKLGKWKTRNGENGLKRGWLPDGFRVFHIC